MKTWSRRAPWILLGLAVAWFIWRAFQPVPVVVDVATIERTSLDVTVDDDGQTRVRERYTISAPIQGRLLRTRLEPGDPVVAGETVVAEFAPVAAAMLDERSLGEARARLLRAEAAVREAEARQRQAAADQEFAEASLDRVRALAREQISSAEDLDAQETTTRRARQAHAAAVSAVQVARFERELAKASLREAEPEEVEERGRVPPPAVPPERPGSAGRIDAAGDGAAMAGDSAGVGRRKLKLHSPISGKTLRVFEESSRTLQAGAPILEVGNTATLEIIADYLTQDAVQVRPGMEVFVEGWGGRGDEGTEQTLLGRVRVVEPGGFTKVSALGVEEQRVNVIVDPVGTSEGWARLGDGFRVELRILLWHEDDVLVAPTGALFRAGGEWAVFAIEDGKARQRTVSVGRRSALQAQVLEGLAEGDRVVLYPSALLGEGTPVQSRLAEE